MKNIVVASNNKHKISEFKLITGTGKIRIFSPAELCMDFPEAEENGTTYEENAIIKATSISSLGNNDYFVLADDSGLEVMSLGNRPGLHSARYAGKNATNIDRINKLLAELKGIKNRIAKFISVIAIITPSKKIEIFRGEITGQIIEEIKGENGFGYDPIFVPKGYSETFAELPSLIKDKISHRAIAMQKALEFILKS